MVDVYKGKYEYEHNLIDYALYIMYIPHLFLGPITRYDEIKKQIETKRKITLDNVYSGSLRIVWGLCKKLIIAGRISILVSIVAGNTNIYNGCYALLAMLLYSIQLYSDFSGGIDIVLGISKILGFNLIENFDSPYFAETIKEFWRKWHISLSTWLRDYVYIPLGGNRKGKIKQAINVLITFFVSGLWHGVNYTVWGVIHGLLVLLGDKYKTRFKTINRIINYVLVSFLWSFFIWRDTNTALKMMLSVFTNFNIGEVYTNFLSLGLAVSDWIVLVIATIMLFVFEENKKKIKIKNISSEKKLILICMLVLIVLVFGIYGIGFNVSEFIYSKF